MHAGTRGARPLVLVVGVLVLLAGCTADAGSTVRNVSVMTRSGCPTAYPQRLTLTAVATEATPPLRDLRACTGDPGTGPVLLYNGGRAAWRVVPGPYASRVVGGGRWSHWFRNHVAVAAGVVLPGESALVWAPPGTAAWRLDRGWTVAWTSLSAGIRTLPASGGDSRTAAAEQGSLRGRALVTCALTALHLRRTPSLVGALPSVPSPAVASPQPTPPAPPSTPPVAPPTAPGGGASPLRGLTGLDALQATWAPSTTACSADWERSDRRLEEGAGTAVRWWTAWQRAKGWLTRVARDLQWLDHDGGVVVRTRS